MECTKITESDIAYFSPSNDQVPIIVIPECSTEILDADACCTASEGTTMSLLIACLEERVTVGVDESFTWNESTQECSKFSDFEYRYFAPSDTGMKGNFFTLPGDGSPTIESRDDCCKASNAGQDVALL